MRITLTESGIAFGSLVKLYSVGFFIGMGILLPFIFAVFSLTLWRHQPMPGLFFFWLIFPVMLAFQSLFTAVIVATGVKLYGKLGKFEVSSEEKPEHTVASDHQ